jgi:isopenicillin-N N-acyltransferase-like protein
MSIKVLLGFALIAFVLSAECHGQPGARVINHNPTWTGQPRLLKIHPHGKLFEVGEGSTITKLLHVYGNMYQMGYAHGTLLREELNVMLPEVWEYLKTEFEDALPKKMPAFLKKPASGLLTGTALDLTYEITLPFANRKYY